MRKMGTPLFIDFQSSCRIKRQKWWKVRCSENPNGLARTNKPFHIKVKNSEPFSRCFKIDLFLSGCGIDKIISGIPGSYSSYIDLKVEYSDPKACQRVLTGRSRNSDRQVKYSGPKGNGENQDAGFGRKVWP